jgi:hypothetical protein
MEIKYNLYNVKKGDLSARVWYTLDNRTDEKKCITIYARDYSHDLGQIFPENYENNSDSMTDYFEKGTVRLFEDYPNFQKIREIVEKHNAKLKEKHNKKWGIK